MQTESTPRQRMRYKGLSSIHTSGSAEKRGRQARQATAPHPARSTIKDNTVPCVSRRLLVCVQPQFDCMGTDPSVWQDQGQLFFFLKGGLHLLILSRLIPGLSLR